MTLKVPPIVTSVELEMAALPDPGETTAQLAARLAEKGYIIISILEDRVVLTHTIEE